MVTRQDWLVKIHARSQGNDVPCLMPAEEGGFREGGELALWCPSCCGVQSQPLGPMLLLPLLLLKVPGCPQEVAPEGPIGLGWAEVPWTA